MKRVLRAVFAAAVLMAASNSNDVSAQTITPVAPAEAEALDLTATTFRVHGRSLPVDTRDGPMWRRQWPGTYFETAFIGEEVYFRLGAGQRHIAVSLDGEEVTRLLRPDAGLHRVSGLQPGAHTLRIDLLNEAQAGPSDFGGFLRAGEAQTGVLRERPHQIEFIGDSHTVGYGIASETRECTEEDVWLTTDTSKTYARHLAARYDADYQVNAISGRGIVRNYDGYDGLTIPDAYPFALLEGPADYDGKGWAPDLLVISLGTNDFSTPLNDGERWADSQALRADYIATYVDFVERLRARYAQVPVFLWASSDNGAVVDAVAEVERRLTENGMSNLGFVAVPGLTMTGCHWHPDRADSVRISAALAEAIDAAGVFTEIDGRKGQ